MNDLYDENESLRERLGLDPAEPIDLSQYKKNKVIKEQDERSNSEALQKEVRDFILFINFFILCFVVLPWRLENQGSHYDFQCWFGD